MEYNSIGSRLKQERVRMGLDQGGLAAIGDIKKNAQSNYERNVRVPDANYLSKVFNAGVNINYVITGVMETNKNESNPYGGIKDEVDDYVFDLIESTRQRYGQDPKEFGGSRLMTIARAAYRFKMNQDDMDFFYRSAHTLVKGRTPPDRTAPPTNTTDKPQ